MFFVVTVIKHKLFPWIYLSFGKYANVVGIVGHEYFRVAVGF